MIGLSGCVQQPAMNREHISIPSVRADELDHPKYKLATYYSSDAVVLQMHPPQYTLPIDISQIENFNTINALFSLNIEQKNLLSNNGFVVCPFSSNEDDIITLYTYLKKHNIPIFVTSDTLLHLYHIQFDQILKGIEEREFFYLLLNITKVLYDQSIADYETFTAADLKEAARRNSAFFAVALSLLQTPTETYNGSEDIPELHFTIPAYIQDLVKDELTFIQKHQGFMESPVFIYAEDYSQYVPRGHYTQSEKLKRYFTTMMWYGRISFLIKGGEPHGPDQNFLISAYDAKIQTLQACLIASALPSITLDGQPLQTFWDRLYAVTSFFVGVADDLTPYEYLDCIQQVFGSSFPTIHFTNDEKLLELKIKLAEQRSPKIYGGTGNSAVEIIPGKNIAIEDLNKVLDKTKGMRFMGQRFVPDSYIFQQLVFPAVGPFTGTGTPFTGGHNGRLFPRGLDVMAILGSRRAKDILINDQDTAYIGYYEQFNKLQENFSMFTITDWNKNLYFSWLYTLQSLLSEKTDVYPTFMTTDAWLDKQLQTCLASWTELRHDTILYAKQSYTPTTTSVDGGAHMFPVVGYVEPTPEFYTRLLALTRMTTNGLSTLGVLTETETVRLQNLANILIKLRAITIDELEGTMLTEDQYEFIRNFGDELKGVVLGVNDKGKETTLIADVHTDTNTGLILEEAVGYVDLIIVAYKLPDGRVLVGAGPVFSYYEFKQPMHNRLTNEAWIEILEQNQQPDRPTWIQSFYAE
ncbi:MAG: DUF3160 domain-containing protein [Candidatus Thermoplasmatota archaeon]